MSEPSNPETKIHIQIPEDKAGSVHVSVGGVPVPTAGPDAEEVPAPSLQLELVKPPAAVKAFADRLRCGFVAVNNTSTPLLMSQLESNAQWEAALPLEVEAFSGYGALGYGNGEVRVDFELADPHAGEGLASVAVAVTQAGIRDFVVEALSSEVAVVGSSGGNAAAGYVFSILIDSSAGGE